MSALYIYKSITMICLYLAIVRRKQICSKSIYMLLSSFNMIPKVVEEIRQSRLKHGVTHRRHSFTLSRQFFYFQFFIFCAKAWRCDAYGRRHASIWTDLSPPTTHTSKSLSKSRKQWNSLGKSCRKA